MSITELLGTPVNDPMDGDTPHYGLCTPPPRPPALPTQRSRYGGLLTIAVAAGALILGVGTGWLLAGNDAPSEVASAAIASTPIAPAQVSGIAEMFTAVYLAGTTPAADLDAFYSGSAEQGTGSWVNQTAAVRIEPSGNGFWDVTVAADSLELAEGGYRSVGIQYFKITVADQSPYPVVVAAPARIPAPEGASVTNVPTFRDSIPPDQATAVGLFLNGYLTGAPAVARYVTPTARIDLFGEPPYDSVVITSLLADPLGRVLASASATTPIGAIHTVQYVLDMSFEAGVWEVADLTSIALGQ